MENQHRVLVTLHPPHAFVPRVQRRATVSCSCGFRRELEHGRNADAVAEHHVLANGARGVSYAKVYELDEVTA